MNDQIQITPLGAGQDVGRSCILVSIGGKNVMLDCGMHMGYDDERRFPDFSYICKNPNQDLTDRIDCVVISHFHLDHCGALPYFTEMCGYDGPIYMTHPTKAICPLLLEDYRKITVDRKAEKNLPFFTSDDIKNCMQKVTAIHLRQTIRVDEELEICAYYAGHVLGAAMILVKVGGLSVVYTGDYNMTPDRHLGAAFIDRIYPNVLITETTYATTLRDSKRARERDFLRKVHECVEKGGKVLIPVFALGRAQELCILMEQYWERMGLKVPVYFSAGMTQRANSIYKTFINWTNQKLKKTFLERNMFDFKHIKPFDMSYADNEGGQVLFASPGMLHAGFSLEVFKKWAPNPANMVILPGYCVPGTVGARVLAGEKVIELDKVLNVQIHVNLQVEYLSFSAHADAKGIMQLIEQCQPKNVLLVHGEAAKMEILKASIVQDFQIACYSPANGQTVSIQGNPTVEIDVSTSLVQQVLEDTTPLPDRPCDTPFTKTVRAQLCVNGGKRIRLEKVSPAECTPNWVHLQLTLPLAEPGILVLAKIRDLFQSHGKVFTEFKHKYTLVTKERAIAVKLVDASTLEIKWQAGESEFVENFLLPMLQRKHPSVEAPLGAGPSIST